MCSIVRWTCGVDFSVCWHCSPACAGTGPIVEACVTPHDDPCQDLQFPVKLAIEPPCQDQDRPLTTVVLKTSHCMVWYRILVHATRLTWMNGHAHNGCLCGAVRLGLHLPDGHGDWRILFPGEAGTFGNMHVLFKICIPLGCSPCSCRPSVFLSRSRCVNVDDV